MTTGCLRAKPGADALAALKEKNSLSQIKAKSELPTLPRAARGVHGEGLAPAVRKEPSISNKSSLASGRNINIKIVASFEMKRLNKPLTPVERGWQSSQGGFACVPQPQSPQLHTGCFGRAQGNDGPFSSPVPGAATEPGPTGLAGIPIKMDSPSSAHPHLWKRGGALNVYI